MSEMLNLGNGDYTGARLYHHVTRLIHTFEMLGGLQQCHLGPDPVATDKLNEMWHDYHLDATPMLQQLANDLGYEVVLTATFPPCAPSAPKKRTKKAAPSRTPRPTLATRR